MNTMKIHGNLTADPELKFGNSGKVYARFRVAESRGENKESIFYDVTAYDTIAENATDSLHKGDRVTIDGYFEGARTYTAQNGETRVALDVTAQDLYPSLRFATVAITRKQRNESGAPASQSPANAYAFDEEPF